MESSSVGAPGTVGAPADPRQSAFPARRGTRDVVAARAAFRARNATAPDGTRGRSWAPEAAPSGAALEDVERAAARLVARPVVAAP